MGENMPSGKKRSRNDFWKIWGPLVLLVVIAFALAIASLDEPPPKRLTIASGSKGGAYFAFAERYREALAAEGYELEVLETAGSVENLDLLHRGEVDLAIVQGGTAEGPAGDLVSLGGLFSEPLWVFVDQRLAEEELGDLAGRRLAVGVPGSGTRALALLLLEASGVGPEEAELLELSGDAAVAALDAGEADAAFFVTAASAAYIEALLADERFEPLSFRRHRAYHRHFPFLSRVLLGEGVYDLADNLPREDVSLLAAVASLVGHEDLSEDLVPLILGALEEVHGPGSLFDEAGAFPSTRFSELPLLPAARHYLDSGPPFLYRFLPFRYALAIDRLKILLLPLLTLLLPLGKVAPPLYRWRVRSRIYRWYEDLRRIDGELREDKPDALELGRLLESLERLEAEVMGVTVPLSHMDELYHLRIHIDFIAKKLAEKLDAIKESTD